MSNKEKYDKGYFENDDFLINPKYNCTRDIRELYKEGCRKSADYKTGYINFLVDGLILKFLTKIDKFLLKYIGWTRTK